MIRKSGRQDDDFGEEVRAHLDLEADQLIEEGMSPDAAKAAARRSFGNVTQVRERFYESSRRMWLENLVRDVRHALRQIRHSPITTTTIIASLALGIGLTTAIFSLADQALVRALLVRAPEELVQLHWDGKFIRGAGKGSVGFGSLMPFPLYKDLREENDVFADVFARTAQQVHIRGEERSEALQAEIVTGSYFPTLGVRPALGRLLGEVDDQISGAHPVVVLSYAYWQRRLGADPDVLGTQVRMNDHPMTVIGVAQQGFHGTDWSQASDVWIPMAMKARATGGWSGLDERRSRFAHVFARLAPGVDRSSAAAQLEPWFANYLRADTEREGWPVVTEPQMEAYLASKLDVRSGGQGQARIQTKIQQPMLILLAATALIFLLACLNVANLSLARALAGRRATALRSALGASRRRIVTGQLIEGALLATMGCALGALLAPAVSRIVLSFLAQQKTGRVSLESALDSRVLLFAVAATALTTLISGAAPAFYAASIRPIHALRQQSSGVAAGPGLRKALVVGQFTLALVLLVGAGLFGRTLGSLRGQGPGFSTTNLMMFTIRPANDGVARDATKPLARDLLAALRAIPEVEKTALSVFEMLTGGGWKDKVTLETSERTVTERSSPINVVSPGFFSSLGTSIVLGRDFDPRDDFVAPGSRRQSVIVNEAFVERYLSNIDPIGARMGVGDRPDVELNAEIVGVVQSFRDSRLRAVDPQIFFSLWERERAVGQGTFYVRTRVPSDAAIQAIRAAVEDIEPSLTLLRMRTIDDQLDRMLANERMLATLAGAFAVLATLLAMIGLYGVLSFSAERRTREIGIRLALGAQRWSAGVLIVREALGLAAIGLVIALPLAYALGRLVEHQLFGVRPLDVPTFAVSIAALVGVCLVAAAFPARRVGTMNPLDVLRNE